MAAYASLVSLMQIIHQIEHHPSLPTSMDKKQVESLTEIVMFLQEFFEGYKSPYADSDEADPLEMRIADAVYAAEDVIEFYVVDQIRPDLLVLYEALNKVIKDMNSIVRDNRRLLNFLYHSTSSLEHKVILLFKRFQCIEVMVIKDMDLFIEVKGQLHRQVSASTVLYASVVKVIEHLDLIRKEVRQLFALDLAGSSTYLDMVKVVEHMDLIKKEVLEIVAIQNQLHKQVSASAGYSTSADLHKSLHKVIEDMELIKKEVKEIVVCKDHSASAGSSTSSLARLSSTTMVGFDDVQLQLMEKLIYGEHGRQVIPVVGMGGIGKTTLAEHVYAHPSIRHHFDICAWVTISQQYNAKELLYEILSETSEQMLGQMSNDEIGLALHKCLSYRRYLIVLDDMWSIEAWERIQRYFPDNSNGSRIMVTTRLSNLGSQLDSNYSLKMEFMDEESSWSIFCNIVFGGKSCPFELEKIGKKIVESCRGLPLSIVLMGGLLEKLEPVEECWESVRRNLNSLVNLENDKYCLKILKLSYNHLPVYLKPCFMHMGMFEEDSEIRVSTLIKLWVSEGFLKPVSGKSLERVAKEYLDELVDRNLILVHKFGKTGNMKYLKMHDLLRDVCLREAERERFYHVVGQHSPQGTCSQRRVVIMENASEEKVADAMNSRPYARTCISGGKRVQSLSNLRLLRTLKTYNKDDYLQDYYSPGNLFDLVNLRLLIVHSGRHSTKFPSSISLLWSLQTLIVGSEENIDAPVEIWNMPQLRHVHFYGFGVSKNITMALCLPDPPCDKIVIMENLQTLKGVRNFTCDEMMVRRIPNIKKLGLVYDRLQDGYCLHNIEHLQKLESFHCKGFITDDDSLRKLTFPQSLKSVALKIPKGGMEDILKEVPQSLKSVALKIPKGGMEDILKEVPQSLKSVALKIPKGGMEDIMEKVSALPLLQKLKLYGGYFTTGTWETVEGQFLSLKYLSLVWCHQLELWMMESSHFPCLEHLYLYRTSLKEIPAEVGEIPTLKSVTLIGCSESAVKSAKRMVEEQEELQGEDQLSFQVTVQLSLKDYIERDELLSLANPNFQIRFNI